MVVVLGNYTAPLEEVDVHRERHLGFVRGLVDEGRLLAAGRREAGDGSVLLFAGNDPEDALALLGEDPYALAGLVEYEAIAVFTPGAVAPGLDGLTA